MGDVPDDVAGASMKRIRANALQPLSPDEDVTSRHGWASLEDPFDTELDHEKVFFNEYVVLAMRVDAWVVPGPLLKAHLRDAERALLERKGLERLGRKAKSDLKTAVVKKLRHRLVPRTTSVDLVWNLQTNVACFFSHAKRMHELVQELFEKTFRLRLLVESPGTATHRREPGLGQAFAALEPTSLAEAP